MGRGPFAKMMKFEYSDNDPVTISEEQKEALKKSPYYFDLNKLKNEKFHMMVFKIGKRQNNAQAIDDRPTSEN